MIKLTNLRTGEVTIHETISEAEMVRKMYVVFINEKNAGKGIKRFTKRDFTIEEV